MKQVLSFLWPLVIVLIALLFMEMIWLKFKSYSRHKARARGFAFARDAVLVSKTMNISDLLDKVQEAKDFGDLTEFDAGVLDFVKMDRAFNYTLCMSGFDPEAVELSSNQKQIKGNHD